MRSLHSSRWAGTDDDGSGWRIRPTPAVRWLLIINCGVFCLQQLFGLVRGNPFESFFQLAAMDNRGIDIRHGCLWQFFTYMFLHGSVLHLLFNLIPLYFFGNEMEATMGSRRFLQMYFLGGVVGGLIWYLFNFDSMVPMVGASGAIFAVMIAFAMVYPHRPITLLVFFVLPITLRARTMVVGTVVISVLYLISGENGGVAHLAHLGGAAVGYLYIKAMGSPGWASFFARPFLRRSQRTSSSSHLKVLNPPPMKKEEFIEQQIDPILDKIARHGIQSLTREERRLLDEARDRLSQ